MQSFQLIKRRIALFLVLTLAAIGSGQSASAQSTLSTAIPYQGQLTDGGAPANGQYDFEFKLFDATSAGSQIGATATKDNVPVTNGLFAVELDFGGSAFTGASRFLEIGVRAGSSTGSFTALTPRRPLLAVPYALYSPSGSKPAYGMDAAAPNNAVYVADGGNVGIGISAPTDKLHIVGHTRIGGSMHIEGALGIGTSAPTDKLHVAGHARIGGSLLIEGEIGQNLIMGGNSRVNEVIIGSTNPDVKWIRLLNEGLDQHMGIVTSHLVVHNKIPSDRTPIYFDDGSGTHWEIGINLPNSPSGSFAIGVAAGARMYVESNGNVTAESLKLFKTAEVGTLRITGGADLAEPFTVTGSEAVEPGTVVVLDADHPGQVRVSDTAYDSLAAGIVSGAGGINPGLVMNQEELTIAGESHPVALTGKVYVKAVGPIKVGDLLTTSTVPGHAMAATDRDRAFGATLGKAMSNLDEGTGLVLVLVSLQ